MKSTKSDLMDPRERHQSMARLSKAHIKEWGKTKKKGKMRPVGDLGPTGPQPNSPYILMPDALLIIKETLKHSKDI